METHRGVFLLLVLDHEVFECDIESVGVGRRAVQSHLEDLVINDVTLSDLHPIEGVLRDVNLQAISDLLGVDPHVLRQRRQRVHGHVAPIVSDGGAHVRDVPDHLDAALDPVLRVLPNHDARLVTGAAVVGLDLDTHLEVTFDIQEVKRGGVVHLVRHRFPPEVGVAGDAHHDGRPVLRPFLRLVVPVHALSSTPHTILCLFLFFRFLLLFLLRIDLILFAVLDGQHFAVTVTHGCYPCLVFSC
mmetsp:Transcript_19638/g.54598  ORF Transcript_19638/g.54598 Transcript_19638/m.54598 type:complete len:244 (+) Transcript_19638:129-860(+)